MSRDDDKYSAALDYAAKQLSYRMQSRKLLRDKLLKKGHDEEATDYAIAWLDERGLLDDKAYAETLVRGYMRRGYGAARIRQELWVRGVGKEDSEAAMRIFEPNFERMRIVLDKRLRGDTTDRKEVDKAVAALRRRGFSWQEIKEALSAYAEEQGGED